MDKGAEDRQERLRQLFHEADPEVRQVVLKVFELEDKRLYMGSPIGIVDEITNAIKQIVTE